jgi:two-component system NarL family sensor kinase
VYSLMGLVGGVAFDALGAEFGLDRNDSAFALLVPPVYIVLMLVNLGLVAMTVPGLSREARRRVFRESGTPMIPLELLSAVTAATAVLLWVHFGLLAVVGLLAVLLITIALARMLGSALKTDDDLVALRDVSDRRAAEVARLSSDRDRLLSEVLDAEQRERARLAESLHDGPMQRLVALRQDLGEADGVRPEQLARPLEEAIAETRALISAFHPATVRELGFEGSLRAAVAPFPAARTTRLDVRGETDDPLLLPVAQELVVNAVKHARPSAIDVVVTRQDGQTALEVNDDGVGMDAETTRTVQAGHLGLAMVRRRVEDAGGTLDIATRADGGTRSRVVLPSGHETRMAPD